jgi:hypothetical protein
MISELAVVDCLPPRGSFIRSYLHYALHQTTAPLPYHLGTALSMLAATCPPEYGMWFAGSKLYPNLYVLLVGRSGEDQKSTALRVGTRLLKAEVPTLLGDNPGSAEGLIESLATQPTQLIVYSEFGKTLASAQQKYFEPIKTTLTDLWDCLSDDTEVLTEQGWRGMGQVSVGDRVWTLNKESGGLELLPATDVGRRDVRDDEQMVTAVGQRLNVRTTEGHNFHIKYRDPKTGGSLSARWLTVQGRDMVARRSAYGLPLTGRPEASFPGMGATEGELVLLGHFLVNGTVEDGRVVLPVRAKDVSLFSFWLASAQVMAEQREAAGGVEFLLDADLSQRLVALSQPDVLQRATVRDFRFLWGGASKVGLSGVGASPDGAVWVRSEAVRDALMQMAVLRGDSVQCSERQSRNGTRYHRISIRNTDFLSVDPGDKRSTKFVFADKRPGEQVWCVTNDNGTLVTRRGGSVCILGNCDPTQRKKANNKTIRVETPRLSIAAACSLPYLEKHTMAEDWTGGFMGRWLVFYSRRSRTDPDPKEHTEGAVELRAFLRQRSEVAVAGDCTGLTADAQALWNDWFNEVSERKLPSNIIGIRSRAPAMARKIALCLGWDYGPAALGQPWQMDADMIQIAIRMTELHIQSVIGVSKEIAEHSDGRLRRQVFNVIREAGAMGQNVSLGELCSLLQYRKRTITDMLDSLTEGGEIMRLNDPERGAVWQVSPRSLRAPGG